MQLVSAARPKRDAVASSYRLFDRRVGLLTPPRVCSCWLCHRGPLAAAMQTIRTQVAYAKEHRLFRAASAWQITSELWRGGPVGKCKGRSCYASLPCVSEVDFFVTHSWSCPSWRKTLAMCHFLNLDLAMAFTCLTWLLVVLILAISAGGLTTVAGSQSLTNLWALLMGLPMVARW